MTNQLKASKTTAEELGQKNEQLTQKYSAINKGYQTATERNKKLAAELKSLEEVNVKMEAELNDLSKANKNKLEESAVMLSKSNRDIEELKQKYQLMIDDNQLLKTKHAQVVKQNEEYASQVASLMSKNSSPTVNSLVPNSSPAKTEPAKDVTPFDRLETPSGKAEPSGDLKLMNVPGDASVVPTGEGASTAVGFSNSANHAQGASTSKGVGKSTYGIASLLFLLLTAVVGIFVFFTMILERKKA